MRRMSVLAATFFLSVSGPSFAQEWIQYASKADLFGVNFPTEPQVQDLAYTSEFNLSLPATSTAQRADKPLLGHRGGLLGRRKLHAPEPHNARRTAEKATPAPTTFAPSTGLDRQRFVENSSNAIPR